MSGDVQPRKRKDKKRKKEESSEQIPPPPQTPLITSLNEDLINIHVHKEEGTGGGICAKIIFFLLFSALAVVIGLIITEHRGLTDLDTADQESRFSQIFEGWVDNNVGHEDDHDEHITSSLEDEDHDEHDEEESTELQHDEEEEEEKAEEASEEASHADEEEEEEEVSQAEDEEGSQAEDEETSQDEEEEEEEDEGTAEEEEPLESEEVADDESEAKDEVSEEPEEEEEEEEEEVEASKEAEQSLEEEEEDEESQDEAEEQQQSQEKEVSKEVKEEDDEEEQNSVKEDEEEEKADEEKQEGEEENVTDNSKSVNVRHDNEPEESESEKDSEKQSDDDVEAYEYENITNKEDSQIKEKIDEAQKNIKDKAAYAIKLFDVLLQNNPSSPRSLYGKAQALDLLADQRRSNDVLQQAIAIYLKILDLKDVPDALYEIVAERCISRLRFLGNYNRAIDVHNTLITRFPDNPTYQIQLAVSYLTINRVNKARAVLRQILSKYPNDGFALVHYGFILKTADNNLSEAVSYLSKGIATKEPGVIDGRFYFHLGDALARLGRNDEAMKIYEEGVKYNLFLSKYQRSLYNVARLEGKPWWKKEETPYLSLYSALENNWEKIRDEGLSVLKKNGLFQNESENLKNTGDWKQFELFARGQKNTENCKKCPFTCKIIESIPDAKGCRRGQTKFSVMHPGTHVWPHCGPTNCRLRVHLGLHVPEHTYIRVANEMRSWRNGKVLIFDDSFEHEVWHNGTTLRLVLIVDVWHPQLTTAEKRSLSPI